MKSNYFTHLVCLVLIGSFKSSNSQIENFNEKCITSDGLLGVCIQINRCAYLFSNIENHLENNRDYLKANRCGYFNGWPMICCQTEKSPNFSKFNSTIGKCISLRQSIFRGKVAGKFDYRWLATLYIGEPQNIFCSGVLINQNYVLTVAHCLDSFPSNLASFGLRLGEVTLSKRDCTRKKICEQDFQIIIQNDTKIHPQYNRFTKKNDIGLITLRSNYTKSSYIGIGCIPTLAIERQWDLNTTSNVTIAGWGQTETTNLSDNKLQAVIQIVPHDKCKQIYGKYGIDIDVTQICAIGLNQEDACSGDSGASISGLVERNEEAVELVFGITSFGLGCGTNTPGVYTRISSFLEWIEENTP